MEKEEITSVVWICSIINTREYFFFSCYHRDICNTTLVLILTLLFFFLSYLVFTLTIRKIINSNYQLWNK